MANVKLRRLKIEKYRNVAPGTELVFNDTFNVPLGQNGTGKTTLLDLIAIIIKSDFAGLKEEEFSLDYDISFLDEIIISTHIENRRQEHTSADLVMVGSLSIDMSNVGTETLVWKYAIAAYVAGESSPAVLTLTADSQGAVVELINRADPTHAPLMKSAFDSDLRNYFLRILSGVTKAGIAKLAAADEVMTAFLEHLVAAERVNENLSRNAGRFDEAIGGFNSITDGYSGPRGGDLRDARLLSQREKEKLLAVWSFVPEDIYKLFGQEPLPSMHPEGIRLSHSDLPFLQKAVDIFGFKAADALFRFSRRDVNGAREVTVYKSFEFVLTLDDDTTIRHDLLSYGQKRLLSFFYYVAAIRDVVIADELVNGLHYDWIEACLREIDDRQSFLTSQNPLLLDFLPFESAEQVQHTFILCRTEKRDGKTWMVWSNMSAESAETFYRAYKTEALQVSEILRSRGLW